MTRQAAHGPIRPPGVRFRLRRPVRPAHFAVRPVSLLAALILAGILSAGAAVSQPIPAPPSAGDTANPRRLPPAGTEIVGFENLEGVMIVDGVLRSISGADTTVRLVLDTGAGWLSLDRPLALAIGLVDSAQARDATTGDAATQSFGFAPRALPRLRLETLEMDQVQPVLVFDAGIIREVTDRPVHGLIGQSLFHSRALQVDYRTRTIAIIPVPSTPAMRGDGPEDTSAVMRAGRMTARSRAALAGVLSANAVPISFTLAGDGKILVQGRVSDARPPHLSSPLTLVLDTGATKTVFFTDDLERLAPRSVEWRSLSGIAAPTLFGMDEARIVRVPLLEVSGGRTLLRRLGVDAAVMRSDLAAALSEAVGQPVHGLLGYSFLRHYRLTIDYPNRVAWFEPQPEGWNERPYEYSNVGLQLVRRGGGIRVLAVVSGSPAARAGILAGDELLAVGGRPVDLFDVAEASRGLEGPPGTTVTLRFRRGTLDRNYRLVRRWLL